MNRRIRLLYVTKSTGGVASYVRSLVKGLDRDKFSITVACLSENGKEFSAELRQNFGVQAFSLAMNRYRVNPFTDFRVLLELFFHLRKNRYDVIHAHASKPGFLARMAAIGTSTPVIYSPHNFAFHEGSRSYVAFVVAQLERFAALFTARIIAVANHERDLALRYRVGNPSLYSVVYTGMDTAPFTREIDRNAIKRDLGIESDARVVGVVGRLASPKLPLEFVRAAEIVHRRLPDVHFIWAGSGHLRVNAEKLSVALGLKDVMHWLGDRSDVPVLLQSLDCLVLPSRWEGFPLAVLEAFAAGVPVVAMKNLGTSEIIESGRTGWLVPVGDVDALSERILAVLTDPNKARQIRDEARKQVDDVFTFERMISNLEKIYETESALAGRFD